MVAWGRNEEWLGESIGQLLIVINTFVNFLVSGDGFTCAWAFHIVNFKYAKFVVCQLYFNTVVKNLFYQQQQKKTPYLTASCSCLGMNQNKGFRMKKLWQKKKKY